METKDIENPIFNQEHQPVTAEPEDPFHHLRIPPPLYMTNPQPSVSASSTPYTTVPNATSDFGSSSGSYQLRYPYSDSLPAGSTAIQMDSVSNPLPSSASFQSKWPNISRGSMFAQNDTNTPPSYTGYPSVTAVRTSSQMNRQPIQMSDIPMDYMPWSIFSVLCCCFCLGLVACNFSAETTAYIRNGDLAKAKGTSATAKYCNIASLVCGVTIITVFIALYLTDNIPCSVFACYY